VTAAVVIMALSLMSHSAGNQVNGNLDTASSSGAPKQRVLIADDQPDVLAALRLLLKSSGYQIEAVSSTAAILRALESRPFDLILMDLNYSRDTTSGQEGLDVLSALQELQKVPPVIVMTAWGSIELAVEAMRRGARDFVMKPWDNARLVATVRSHINAPVGGGAAPAEEYANARTHSPSTPSTGAVLPPPGRDLQIAKQVQGKLLPQRSPQMATLDYYGSCRQAGAVGGDYYDFLELAPGRLGLALGDVSGKGVPAALLMANLQGTVRSCSAQALDTLSSMLCSVNQLFFESTAPEHFATLFFGDYDERHRLLRYANCGHNAPVLLRASGSLERLQPTATVIGAFPRYVCGVAESSLAAGDTLLVFTDGAIEGRNRRGEEFGEARLIQLLREQSRQPIDTIAQRILDAHFDYAEFEQEDDITMIVARAR
jgi:phosphoserine phosphatase RsbU/P